MKFFNITGSCDPARHYMIPAERRLVGVQELIDKQACFVIHAPRQTGKTTSMKALARRLTDEGRHAALGADSLPEGPVPRRHPDRGEDRRMRSSTRGSALAPPAPSIEAETGTPPLPAPRSDLR